MATLLAIANLSAKGDTEIAGNTTGRVTNKDMEGLAITPDGTMLVGIMQAPLGQDRNKVVRTVTIDIASGLVKEYAYQLTTGSGVSEIVAIAGGNKFYAFALSDASLGATFQQQQIPEPQSLALMLLGLGATGLVKRRKSSSAL